jgi:hypothetical protein
MHKMHAQMRIKEKKLTGKEPDTHSDRQYVQIDAMAHSRGIQKPLL